MHVAVDPATGYLAALKDLKSGRELINPSEAPGPLWELVLNGIGKIMPEMACSVETNRPEPNALEIVWKNFDAAPGLTVRVHVALDPGEASSRWRIRVDGLRNRRLGPVHFPRVPSIAKQQGEVVAVPVWMGEKTGRARHMVNQAGRRREWEYPGLFSMQCLAVYGDTGHGLYLAGADTQGYWKKFAIFGDGKDALGCEIVHLPGNTGSDTIYEPQYDSVIASIQGDWISAAQRYRGWALDQPWAAESRLHSGKTVPWVTDTGIWVWNRKTSGNVLAPAERMAEAAGMPVSVLWHWWHGCPYDVGFPEYLPPREGAEPFKAALDKAHQAGVHAIVYMNQRLWGMTTRSWTDERAERHAVKGPDGKVRPEVYNIFTKSPCASMCMGTPFWRDKYAGLAAGAINLGVDGIYMDQACSSHACFDASHGHPLGGGTYWMTGFKLLESDIRNRAGHPVGLAGEGCGELWLPRLDLMLSLQVSMERYAAPGDWEPIPFFHAVYHGYGVFFGNYSSLAMPPYDPLWPEEFSPPNQDELLGRKFSPQFKMEQARAFVWGQQPCLANFAVKQLDERKPEIDYFVKLARLRQANRKYFLDGIFLRPPALDVPTEELDISRLSIYAGRRDNLKEYRKICPRVYCGAWLAKQGPVAVALASITDHEVNLTFKPDPEWPVAKQGTIYVSDESGRRLIRRYDGEIGQISVDLPPNGAAIVEIE